MRSQCCSLCGMKWQLRRIEWDGGKIFSRAYSQQAEDDAQSLLDRGRPRHQRCRMKQETHCRKDGGQRCGLRAEKHVSRRESESTVERSRPE